MYIVCLCNACTGSNSLSYLSCSLLDAGKVNRYLTSTIKIQLIIATAQPHAEALTGICINKQATPPQLSKPHPTHHPPSPNTAHSPPPPSPT